MNNKVFFGLVVVMLFILVGCGGQKNISSEGNVSDNTAQSVATTGNNNVKSKGSCNSINVSSQCVDYVGSVWTGQTREMHCGNGQSGELSSNACPVSQNGGCRTGADTESEAIIWSYPYGGSPVTGDLLTTTKKTCEMVSGSKWID